MKGPVECVTSDPNMDKSADFSEYMWMAEEDLEDFDKQVEEELGEELMMHEALDAFEEQQEAALYAAENLYVPRPGQNNRHPDQFGAQPRNPFIRPDQFQGYHANGLGGGNVGFSHYAPQMHYHPGPSPAPSQYDPAVAAALAASSTLNPNAPAFVFNPNAPVFVPSWASNPPVVDTASSGEASSVNGACNNASGSQQ